MIIDGENIKTFIRWGLGFGIVVALVIASIVASTHPYQFNIGMDDRTKEAVTSLSSVATRLDAEIRETKIQLGICEYKLNQTRTT